jgi:hypothetical protein
MSLKNDTDVICLVAISAQYTDRICPYCVHQKSEV